jgi:hypothetical protein
VTGAEETPAEQQLEVDEYEVLADHDVDDDPTAYRPVGPGDVFDDVELGHLATPYRGPVIVVGHPCSLRRGLALQDDVPVAPIAEPGIPTVQHPRADRVLPVRRLLPPGSTVNRVVQLTRTTTVPASALPLDKRCARLSDAGVVALQQRVVGNQIRAKVPPKVIAAHCRGPLTELELWADWRERCVEHGHDPDSGDEQFDGFMRSPSGFGTLCWRDALADHEHARSRAVAAMEAELASALESL